MEAKEVIRRYGQGQRDFRRLNLRGQSFQRQNLSGADFSEADIRGANFKNAILTGTNFCQAKAGLQKRWVTVILLVSLIVSGVSGTASLLAGGVVVLIFDNNLENQVFGWIALLLLIIVYSVILRQGLGAGVASASAFASAFAIASAIPSAFALIFAIPSAFAFAITITFVFAIARARAFTFAIAIASAITFTFTITIALPNAFANAFGLTEPVDIALALAIAIVLVLLAAYLGWRALKGDPRDAWIRTIAIAFAATGGTSFYNADLTDANFTGATLKSTDLREANLTRTCWRNTIKLDRARPGKTILADTAVRELLVSGNGENNSYVKANLRGANLRGANLNKANLKLADISEATLEDANLEWANLTEANCVGTNFTHAYFTGACLEAWNIDSTTTLTNIDCRFVYLLEKPEPGTDNRERRPSSGDFQPGEFTKLFQEVLNTVDLIFQNGIDWKAFVTAFKKVQVENEDTELAIQSIENKGDGVVVVKVSVPPDTNKEKIHSEFTQNYELALKAAEEKYKAELKAKNNEIVIYREQSAQLIEIIKLHAKKPIQNLIDVTAKAESDMSDNSRNFQIDNLDIDQSRANNPNNFNVFNDNARQVNTNNFTPEQKQSLAEAAAEIQQLLNQLSQTNPTTTNKEKMTFVGEVIDKIDNNPTLKNKVINALKAGGVEAFKEAIDHPLVNILMATVEGWTEV
ncbi:MAG: hypothetical protein F6K26_27890 [Moorea sp. SIO2I5]|nr:hypothetical protein [Moorena sp. SIO2I5]